MATVCNNLLWLYTREGNRAKAENMLKEQRRIYQYINHENMEFYNVLSENSNLRISCYQQRVHKMVAAGVAVALIIVIIGMMVYRHQRMRDSEYIYKYVKLAVNRFIATESAFGATRTFYRAFKNKYNLTPTEYRKLSQKNETGSC